MRFARPRFICRPLVLATVLLAGLLPAAEFHGGSLTLDPPRPFVNQSFSLRLELVVSAGCEIRNIQLGGLPADLPLELGELVTQPAVREVRDGQSVDVHRFRSEGRARTAFTITLSPWVQFVLVERRTSGFFSSWNSSQQRLRLPSTALTARELPAANRPDDFTGAIGRFELRGRIEPDVVMPQDIVNLTVELGGEGFLGDARPALPALDARLFKVYPAAEQPAAGTTRRVLSQVIIPQTTQAVSVAAVRFTYFDPVEERYRTTTAGPFQLTFTTRQPSDAPAVRQLALAPAAEEDRGEEQDINASMHREIRRLLPAAIGLLAGLAALAAIRPTHKRLAIVAGLLVCLGAAWGMRLALERGAGIQHPLAQTVRLRLAPGQRAGTIVELPSGTPVQLLERSGAWVRVEARGRRGWIQEAALRAPSAQ